MGLDLLVAQRDERQHGIVKTRRAAQTIYYSLASPDASLLLDTLHDMLAPTDRRQAEAGD